MNIEVLPRDLTKEEVETIFKASESVSIRSFGTLAEITEARKNPDWWKSKQPPLRERLENAIQQRKRGS